MSNSSNPPSRRRPNRFLSFGIFLLAILLFIGGAAALLYLLFSEYSGVRNIWLLACGAPFVFLLIALTVVINLYNRFGRPLENLFNAIDSVAGGDLSARVPENKSDMFSDLSKRFNKMAGELERAEQQRRNLTADIAHELRTPLHVIQGNLEGIMDGVYEPTHEHIKDTLDETKLLSRLVSDLQTLSLAETGQLPLYLTRFLLADLIADLTSSFSSQTAAQNIQLDSVVDNPEIEIHADYDRLNQVLSNLVSNALRYTPAGGRITIETGEKSDVGGKGTIRIQVKDTGTGIPSEDLPFIFDRFWRGDKARTRGAHVTSGLGLSIAKQLVRAHGGTIEVQSVVGEGTNFMIELPDRLQREVN